MKKIILSSILVMIIVLIPSIAMARDFEEPEYKAEALKTLSLFQGVSEYDFDLERQPTRLEALVMFLRMTGFQPGSTYEAATHPFVDVPAWGNTYVNYAYANGYTQGVSATKFGSNDIAISNTYLTFVLRSMGYSDSYNGMFTYADPFTLARRIGILPSSVNTFAFIRSDVALITWEALFATPYYSSNTVAEGLIADGVFTQAQWDNAQGYVDDYYKYNGGSREDVYSLDGVRLGQYACYYYPNGYEYSSGYAPMFTLYADYTFDVSINFGEGMYTGKGYWRVDNTDIGDLVVMNVTTSPWIDMSDVYNMYVASNGDLIMTDGYMGISPVESIFEFIR